MAAAGAGTTSCAVPLRNLVKDGTSRPLRAAMQGRCKGRYVRGESEEGRSTEIMCTEAEVTFLVLFFFLLGQLLQQTPAFETVQCTEGDRDRDNKRQERVSGTNSRIPVELRGGITSTEGG